MFCPNCGNQIDDDSVFCPECGMRFEEENFSAEQETPVESAPQNQAASGQMTLADQVRQNQAKVSPQRRASSQQSAASKGLSRGAYTAIIIASVFVVAAAIIIILFASGVFAPAPQQDTQVAVVTTEQSAAPSKTLTIDDVQPKQHLADYSWEELSVIASYWEEQKQKFGVSSETANAALAEFNLIDSDGFKSTIIGPSDTKTVSFADGTSVEVFLLGTWHDPLADGGPAAFTFMSTSCLPNHAMNPTATNAGGWEGSEMRNWLNSSVLNSIDPELKSYIRPVSKLTNNEGQTKSTSSVTKTTDSLFLFSWKECLGDISWNHGSDTSYIDAVDNAEGEQYKYFKQQGVKGEQGAPCLVRPAYGTSTESVWWMRSSAPNTSTSFGDMGPEVDQGGIASTPEGVVFGFCM